MRIFLNYRRDDAAGQTGRICDRLIQEFGRHSLFMDVEGIPLGVDFVEHLSGEVAACDVLLATIGSKWLDSLAEDGSRRIDNPNDFVRIEIAAAIQRKIPIIPILLDGTKMPRADLLPEDIQALSRRNALDVSHATFHADLNRLVDQLRQKITADRPVQPPPWRPNFKINSTVSTFWAVTSVVGIGALVALIYSQSRPSPDTKSIPTPTFTPSASTSTSPSACVSAPSEGRKFAVFRNGDRLCYPGGEYWIASFSKDDDHIAFSPSFFGQGIIHCTRSCGLDFGHNRILVEVMEAPKDSDGFSAKVFLSMEKPNDGIPDPRPQ